MNVVIGIATLLLLFLLLFLCTAILAWHWRTEARRARTFLALQKMVTEILEPAGAIAEAALPLLQALGQTVGCQAASIFVADLDGNAMRCLSTWSSEVQFKDFCEVSAHLVYAPGTGLPGLVWDAVPVLMLTDLSREQNFSRGIAADKAGIKAVILIPIRNGTKVLGVIELFCTASVARLRYLQPLLLRVGERVALLMRRENQQRHLAASELELRAVIDTAPDGIIYFDSGGRIDSVNKAVVKLLGYKREEMIGNNIIEFLPDTYKQKLGSTLQYYFRTVIRSLVGRATEATGQRKDGSTFPVELTVGRLMVGEREIFTGIIRDITDRKQMEKRVGEFYSTISHELRSPLASIRGSLGLIEGGAIGELPAEVIELVQIARRNCERLIRLINDILDAKKIEAGKLQVNRDILQPDELIFAAIEGLQSFAAESRVALVAQTSAIPPIIGDADRIVQVLTNLLSNAIKYSPAGAEVDVFTAQALNGPAFVRFCVRDCGPGIDSDQLAKLFSEFQQLDSSDSRPKGGTGLGLAISKSIIEQLGGQIGVDNRPGQGTTFWFELPVATAALKVDPPEPI